MTQQNLTRLRQKPVRNRVEVAYCYPQYGSDRATVLEPQNSNIWGRQQTGLNTDPSEFVAALRRIVETPSR